MKENVILEKYSAHDGFTPDAIQHALQQISLETGFVPVEEVHRRRIFDPDKTWRVSFYGAWHRKPALLVIENMRLETDEEEIRRAFRAQVRASGISNVRPPFTYLNRPFDPDRGYGWRLEEATGERVLFAPDRESPLLAATSFIPFYRSLRGAVTAAFWPCEHPDTAAFSRNQLEGWKKLGMERHPDHVARVMPIVDQLEAPYLAVMSGLEPRFMHAHLTGNDVRIGPAGEYVVHANFFWKWRQPGYDVSFPIWSQWLALPDNRRTPDVVQSITETWLKMIHHELYDLVDAEDVQFMVMNRLLGALLLDVPAQRVHRSESAVVALEAALIAEAKRILVT